jgi:hypothetical protein
VPQNDKLPPDMALLPYFNRFSPVLEIPYATFWVQAHAHTHHALFLFVACIDFLCQKGRNPERIS